MKYYGWERPPFEDERNTSYWGYPVPWRGRYWRPYFYNRQYPRPYYNWSGHYWFWSRMRLVALSAIATLVVVVEVVRLILMMVNAG